MMGNVQLVEKDTLKEKIKNADPQILITAGAGDIDKMVDSIKQVLLRA